MDVVKDQCEFRCLQHPDGLPLATRDGAPFLVINGIQVQGREVCDLAPEIAEMRALGAGLLRLYPQAEGMAEVRSEEHTSELQSLMRISYAVFCLKKNTIITQIRRKYYDILYTRHNKVS